MTKQADNGTVRDFAHSYARAGISVVDIKPDGTKKPRGKWKELQSRILTPEEINKRFRGLVGVATITGAVSGNAEALDVDRPELVALFEAAVRAVAPGLLERLTVIASPRNDYGGRHYRYRVEGRMVEGNTKLAESEPEPQFHKNGEPEIDARTGKQRIAPTVWIETRGEGGYILAPGCPGECHETGLPYKHLAGPPLTEMPTITAEEHDILWRVARSFNLYHPEPEQPGRRREAAGRGGYAGRRLQRAGHLGRNSDRLDEGFHDRRRDALAPARKVERHQRHDGHQEQGGRQRFVLLLQ